MTLPYPHTRVIVGSVLFVMVTAVLLHTGNYLMPDEGVILNGAWKMLHGQRLYVDFFEYFSPGAFLVALASFKVFGVSYVAVKVLSVAILIAGLIPLVALGYRISKSVALAATVACTWFVIASVSYPVINHNVYSTTFAILATYFAFRLTQQPSFTLATATGVSVAAVSFFLQTKGVVLFVAFIATLGIAVLRKQMRMQHIAVFVGAAGIALLPAAAIWGRALIVPLLQVAGGYVESNRVSLLPMAITLLILTVTYACLTPSARRRTDILLLSITQLALLASIVNRPDVYHLGLNIFPLCLLMMIVLRERVTVHLPKRLAIAVAAVLLLCLTGSMGAVFMKNRAETAHAAALVSDMQKVIGEEQIFAMPFLPDVYVALRKPNPYVTSLVETVRGIPALLEENLRILKQELPMFVIIDYPSIAHVRYQKNAIDAYIESAYVPVRAYPSGLTIWKRQKVQ